LVLEGGGAVGLVVEWDVEVAEEVAEEVAV